MSVQRIPKLAAGLKQSGLRWQKMLGNACGSPIETIRSRPERDTGQFTEVHQAAPEAFWPTWTLGDISINPPPIRTSVVQHAGGKAASAVNKPHDPAEREANSFSEWLANQPSPNWKVCTGNALSAEMRAYYGRRLGHDFGSVRVHADDDAARRLKGSERVHRRGMTSFAQHQFDPKTREGRRLIAHELTHIVQQREGRISDALVHRDKDPGNDRAKRIAAYKEALKKPDWERAALMLNGFNAEDIERHIAGLDEPTLRAIRDAADVVMKGWPRVVQEHIEKRLKRFELTDFDRDWIKKIAMPILTYSDGSVSLDHRILMIAHARLESGAASKSGQFSAPDGWNVFNLQVDAGTPGTKKVPRWEYKRKVPDDQADKVNLNETIAITSEGRTENWKRYKKLPSGEVREFVQTWVGIPQYADMNEAVKGYLDYLKKMHKTAFTALTDEKKGAAEFSSGIASFGTGYGPDIGKKIQGFVDEMRPKLRKYAAERLSELNKDPNVPRKPEEETVLKQLAG